MLAIRGCSRTFFNPCFILICARLCGYIHSLETPRDRINPPDLHQFQQLIECKLFHKRRREWWKKERAESPTEAISYTDMLTVPGYVSKAADFMRGTGLIGQYQALDNDQQQGFTRV